MMGVEDGYTIAKNTEAADPNDTMEIDDTDITDNNRSSSHEDSDTGTC